ncbi:MAG TPA: hypothetical protein PLZ61_06690 [Candidatus Cryosericum sp.]|nr:hypothetical protein [Candidatus Cryosericum sp.]
MTSTAVADGSLDRHTDQLLDALDSMLTVSSIMQPMEPQPGVLRAKDLLETMKTQNFDYTAVMDHNKVSRYVKRADLESGGGKKVLDLSTVISADNLVAESCPLADALPRLAESGFLLVLRGRSIDRIVTRSDMGRLPVIMYFTSVLHVFEDSLTTVLSSLSDDEVVHRLDGWFAGITDGEELNRERGKLAESTRIYRKKRRSREELRLVDCLYLYHKMRLFQLVHPTWWQQLGADSEEKAESDFTALNGLRNDLAHGNELAATEKEWQDVLATLGQAQHYARALAHTGVQE